MDKLEHVELFSELKTIANCIANEFEFGHWVFIPG